MSNFKSRAMVRYCGLSFGNNCILGLWRYCWLDYGSPYSKFHAVIYLGRIRSPATLFAKPLPLLDEFLVPSTRFVMMLSRKIWVSHRPRVCRRPSGTAKSRRARVSKLGSLQDPEHFLYVRDPGATRYIAWLVDIFATVLDNMVHCASAMPTTTPRSTAAAHRGGELPVSPVGLEFVMTSLHEHDPLPSARRPDLFNQMAKMSSFLG